MSARFNLILWVISLVHAFVEPAFASAATCAKSTDGVPARFSNSPNVARVYAFKELLSSIREGLLSPEELGKRFPTQLMTYQTNRGKPRFIEGTVFGAVKDREGHVQLSFAPKGKSTLSLQLEDLDLVSVTIPAERTHAETSEISQFIERVARRELMVSFITTDGFKHTGLILPEAPPGEFFPGVFVFYDAQANQTVFRVKDIAGEFNLARAEEARIETRVNVAHLVKPMHTIPEGSGRVEILQSIGYVTSKLATPSEEGQRVAPLKRFLFTRSPVPLESEMRNFLLGLPDLNSNALSENPFDHIRGNTSLRLVLKSPDLNPAIRITIEGTGTPDKILLTRSLLAEDVSVSYWRNYVWPSMSSSEHERSLIVSSANALFGIQDLLRESADEFSLALVQKNAPETFRAWKNALPEDMSDRLIPFLLRTRLGLVYSLNQGIQSVSAEQLQPKVVKALAAVVYLLEHGLKLTSKNEAAPRISAQSRPLATDCPGAKWLVPEGTFFERLLSAFEDGGYRYENGIWRR